MTKSNRPTMKRALQWSVPCSTSPISWAMIPVMEWAGSEIDSGMAMRPPITSNTTMVSPIMRPKPSSTAAMMPEAQLGMITFMTV